MSGSLGLVAMWEVLWNLLSHVVAFEMAAIIHEAEDLFIVALDIL